MYDEIKHKTNFDESIIILNGCESALNLAKWNKKTALEYLNMLTDLTDNMALLDLISRCFEEIAEN